MRRLFFLLLIACPLWAQTTIAPKTTVAPKTTSVAAAAVSGATFLGTAECLGTGTVSCTASGLSIPSGSIIAFSLHSQGGITTASGSDSNSDTFTCTGVFTQATNGNGIAGCAGKSGATVTTVTCTKIVTNDQACEILWYSPGTLSGILDQSAGHSENPATTWNTGATGTLATSNQLVVESWDDLNTGRTASSGDGSTQRTTCSAKVSCAVYDRNVVSNAAVTGNGTPTIGNSFQVDFVMTIK